MAVRVFVIYGLAGWMLLAGCKDEPKRQQSAPESAEPVPATTVDPPPSASEQLEAAVAETKPLEDTQAMSLGQFPLVVDGPSDGAVKPLSQAGGPGVTVGRAGALAMVSEASDMPSDLDQAVREQAGTVTVRGQLDNGWFLVSEEPSSFRGADKLDHLVVVLRTIGGVKYRCGLRTMSTIERDNTLAMCKSLRAE